MSIPPTADQTDLWGHWHPHRPNIHHIIHKVEHNAPMVVRDVISPGTAAFVRGNYCYEYKNPAFDLKNVRQTVYNIAKSHGVEIHFETCAKLGYNTPGFMSKNLMADAENAGL